MSSRYKPSAKYGASDKREFVVYDKVFARMKSYPPWPAKIMPQKFELKNKSILSTCIVYFYGTRQIGECNFVDIYDYKANKERFRDVCQSSKSMKNPFQTALDEIEDDDGSLDDPDVDYADEAIEFDAPIKDMVERKQKKVVKKRKRAASGHESMDENTEEEINDDERKDNARTKPGYDSQDDHEDYDSIPEDENTADDDDENDDDFHMTRRSRSQSRSRTKRRKGGGGGARRKAAAPKKKGPKGRKPAHVDSDLEFEEDAQSGLLSNDEDMTGVLMRTRNPANLLKEYIFKELDLHETNAQALAKYEDSVANIHYRSNTITAVLPDDSLVEFHIRPKTSTPAQQLGPADLSAIQARVEEFENLKTLLENGNPIPPEHSTLVMCQLTPEHQAMLKAKRAKTLSFLRVEAKLLEQETILRRSLTMAQVDFKSALAAIDAVMLLDVRPLTLKKYPEVVNTFRKLQRYYVTELKARLPASYQAKFENLAALIRNGADFVMEKFASLFEFPEDISFYEAFYHELLAFIEETRGVPVGDVIMLTD
ncbi:hypothetical protein M8J76_001003 [Diaphorina citri]|nr:hypothetical protein M8J76_001003 [Diaphorina citri]